MKRNIVITIARQYGSGGRTVGEMLANDLGIHYYDHELIHLASEESGISLGLFLDAEGHECQCIRNAARDHGTAPNASEGNG